MYEKLKAGDIRQPKDQCRHMFTYVPAIGERHFSRQDSAGVWRPATLISHPILQSDLIVSEYRRPV